MVLAFLAFVWMYAQTHRAPPPPAPLRGHPVELLILEGGDR